MKSITDQYKMLQEGNMDKFTFLRNVKMTFPKLVSNLTKFDDAVNILSRKGMLIENEIYSPTEYNLGMRYELSIGSDEDKAKKNVCKNLKADSAYYSKFHLSGYNPEAMKVDRKKRTDQPVEVKKDNFTDKSNETKKVKIDKIEEMIGKIIKDIIK